MTDDTVTPPPVITFPLAPDLDDFTLVGVYVFNSHNSEGSMANDTVTITKAQLTEAMRPFSGVAVDKAWASFQPKPSGQWVSEEAMRVIADSWYEPSLREVAARLLPLLLHDALGTEPLPIENGRMTPHLLPLAIIAAVAARIEERR